MALVEISKQIPVIYNILAGPKYKKMNTLAYPEAPKNFDDSITAPSAAFKKQVTKVVISILLFFIVYILLVAAAVVLACVCVYAGFFIIAIHPSFLTIVLGLGAAGVGVSIIFFLIKFIFSVSKDENAQRVEVYEKDQPRLFAFVRKLTTETHTPFPKKIFVSPDVNACVFYNSSFWSMFLPVKKNLEVGLGLVNSINISEFKAVMAHEFGHFSQRSMKLGSFTYNVNRVIYNMLYENTGYSKFLASWGQLSGYLSLFALLTIKIATGIQWVLRGMYTFINKNYLALSREMEFHADAVAASVAGGNNLVSGLSRVEVAQSCYTSALNKANEWLKQNKVSKNIFDNQLSVFYSLANEYQLHIKEGLPEIYYHFIQSFSKTRVNYKNQWASHPTLEERKEHLDQINVNCAPDERKAWEAFEHAEKLQETITGNLYRDIKLETTPETYDKAYFEDSRLKEKDLYTLPVAYKGFYDKRYINMAEWNFEGMITAGNNCSFNDLFKEENGQLRASVKNNEADLETIRAIKDKQIDIKTFDFDGVKYAVKDCDRIITQLEEDIKKEKERLSQLDKDAFIFFYQAAANNGEKVKKAYQQYNEISNENEEYVKVANNIMKNIAPFYQGGLTNQQIESIVGDLKSGDELKLKRILRDVLEKKIVTETSANDLFAKINQFLAGNYYYFVANDFQNNELNQLREIIIQLADEWNEYRFTYYKKMLELQLQYYKGTN